MNTVYVATKGQRVVCVAADMDACIAKAIASDFSASIYKTDTDINVDIASPSRAYINAVPKSTAPRHMKTDTITIVAADL